MRRRERNRKIKRFKLSRTFHRHARCSISSRVHAPYTQTRTKKENVIKIFFFLKNEFLKYPEQAHVRKYYLSCSYFSVHLADSFFLGPGLLGSKTADLCGHLSPDVPAGGTISCMLLCPTQKTLDTFKMPSCKL